MTIDDWATRPVPGEEKIPPLTEVKKWNVAVNGAGLIFDASARGRFTALAVVEMAIHWGWTLQDGDQEIIDKVRVDDLEDPVDQSIWNDIDDEAVDWLNDTICPEGYLFGYSDEGDFMLLTESAWCERAGWPCDDTDHTHPAPDGISS